MRRWMYTALGLALLTACSQGDLTVVEVEGVTDAEDEADVFWLEEGLSAMDRSGGCGDAWLQVWSDEAELGLEVFQEGIIARATEAGEPLRETYEIGETDVELVLEYATPVAANYCSDAPAEERVVHDEWVAVEGSVVFETTPPEVEGGDAFVELDLWNVVLVSAGGEEVLIRHMEIEGIQVNPGWGG